MSISLRKTNWLSRLQQEVKIEGFAVIEEFLSSSFLEETREAMYFALNEVTNQIGDERISRAKEIGIIRTPMAFHPLFFKFIQFEEVLRIIDAVLSKTAILHLQNGFILPPSFDENTRKVFQNSWHMDFPRILGGYLASINLFFTIDDFSKVNGATLVSPKSHQLDEPPSIDQLESSAIHLEVPAGSLIVFDSTLWHTAGSNDSQKNRLAINHQFTQPFFKQQIDYCRALGKELVLKQTPRTQQLLGWFSRPPASLYEFYAPDKERTYRSGQG